MPLGTLSIFEGMFFPPRTYCPSLNPPFVVESKRQNRKEGRRRSKKELNRRKMIKKSKRINRNTPIK